MDAKVTYDVKEHPLNLNWRIALFGIAITLGTFERLSGIANLISMERDWVVIVGSSASSGQVRSLGYDLTHLNSVLRRIDLICKLIGPLAISFIIAGTSMRIGVFVVAGMSAGTWSIEIWSACNVWTNCHALRQPKVVVHHGEPDSITHDDHSHSYLAWASRMVKRHVGQLQAYFGSSIWIPSLALSLLHISVLTYNATLITWLLASGFSLVLITAVRAIGSVVEISSTFVAPYSITYLAETADQKKVPIVISEDGAEEALLDQANLQLDSETDRQHMLLMKHGIGLERCGLWGISLQAMCLVRPSSQYSCLRRVFLYYILLGSLSISFPHFEAAS